MRLTKSNYNPKNGWTLNLTHRKSTQNDYLRKAIKVWPTEPGKALLRANEVALLEQIDWGEPVLDFGCGDGAVMSLLDRTIDVGIDLSQMSCIKAKSIDVYRHVINGNGNSLPFTNEYFHTILCNSVLEHIENIEVVLRELHRVLGRNGVLALAVPGPEKPKRLFYSHWNSYSDSDIPEFYEAYFSRHWQHINYWTPEQWSKLLHNIGFNNLIVAYYEPAIATKIIDLLRSVKLQYSEWENFPKPGGHVQEVWESILYSCLVPYYNSISGETGSGIFIQANK